jgi:hypothetical protein
MTRLALLAVLVIASGGCSKGGGGDEVLAKLAGFEKSMCACADEACAKTVRAELGAYEKGGAMKQPSDEQMKTVMATEHKIDACEAKFVLSEAGTMALDQLRKGLASAKQKVAAGQYAQAGFDCSTMSADSFRRDHGAIAESKPEIKAFLDEYGPYCKEGMHLAAATALVTRAETSRAATPTGVIPECSSPDLILAEVKLKGVPGAAEKLAPLKARYATACGR